MTLSDRSKHYLEIGAVLVIIALIATFVYSVLSGLNRNADTTVATVAKPAPAIAKIDKVDTVIKVPIKTYKPAAKAKLKLPPAVISNDTQQVTGATTVKPSERPVTVTSVIDSKTGETTTYTKPEPYPWVAVESRGEARFSYGYKLTRGQPVPVPVGRLSITQDFVQVKALHIGVTAAVDTDQSAFVGVGLAYRW